MLYQVTESLRGNVVKVYKVDAVDALTAINLAESESKTAMLNTMWLATKAEIQPTAFDKAYAYIKSYLGQSLARKCMGMLDARQIVDFECIDNLILSFA